MRAWMGLVRCLGSTTVLLMVQQLHDDACRDPESQYRGSEKRLYTQCKPLKKSNMNNNNLKRMLLTFLFYI